MEVFLKDQDRDQAESCEHAERETDRLDSLNDEGCKADRKQDRDQALVVK
jgi:hypothetical protein